MQYCHGRKKEHVYCACVMNQCVKRSSMYRHKHQHEILHWHTQYAIICWCSALDYVQRLLAQPSMWQLVETLIILLLPSLLPQVQLQYLMMCVCVEGGGPAHTQTHTQQWSLLKQFTTMQPTAHFNNDRERLWMADRWNMCLPLAPSDIHTFYQTHTQKKNLWSLWKQVTMYNKNWCVLWL